jgi:two-component system chemotaxis response regulator CheB
VALGLVVIGGSWGGTRAARILLGKLPRDFGAPVVLVLHRGPDSDDAMLARNLAKACALRVADAEDKDPLQAGGVLIAPAGYHLLVEDATVALSTDEAVHFSRPSIDVTFESASRAYGEGVAAVILSGANDDGAAGCARIAATGGRVLVQDPATADRSEMPEAALAACPELDLVAEPDALGARLAELAA